MYQERNYRQLHNLDMSSFQVQYEACDLWVAVNTDVDTATLQTVCYDFIQNLWHELYDYIATDSEFACTLAPYTVSPAAPAIARQMSIAAATANVGPMAAVAGCFAQALGSHLVTNFNMTDIIIENGGDIWLCSSQARTIALHAGSSPLSGKLALDIAASTSLSICTSSGTVGHSLSFGQADAVTVVAQDAALADAFATTIANKICDPADINTQLETLPPEILGCVIILGEHIGVKGKIKLAISTIN